jgi:hypothetical protein
MPARTKLDIRDHANKRPNAGANETGYEPEIWEEWTSLEESIARGRGVPGRSVAWGVNSGHDANRGKMRRVAELAERHRGSVVQAQFLE